MRYMDDIIDLEIEKIDTILEKIKNDPEDEFIKLYEIKLWENIKEMTLKGRRTGLGVTGEGDMLAALGLTYGTDDANKFSEGVHRGLKLNAYRSSVNMAKERGAFQVYNATKEAENPFILRIGEEDVDLYNDMIQFGRRNISLLTVAPTGTVSLMTQTTSGIEPVFLPVYKRRRKINPNDKDVRVDYVDETGISWMEYPVFHHNFETWLKVEGYDVDVVKSMTMDQVDEIVKRSPYYKATSNDVDWVKKVEMQGMVQKHVDHSISVTVNLPNDVSEETVAAVYAKGHEVGCKGITVYRDGSRSGVLITDEDKKKKELKEIFKDNHAPKRPKRLKADIVRFQNNLEKWVAVVGKLDGRPYEIFTGKLENGLSDLPSSLVECEVVKVIFEDEEGNRKKRYDIEYLDSNGEKVFHEGLSHTFNEEYWNYAKMISSVLRHGMPIAYVYELVRSLNLNAEHLNTWKAGVERVIKRYITDGEKAKGKCPECGSENLAFKEGCLTCMNCGNSKCG
jgi:ribonucleoside-diphosphate reductase alpha chain